MPRWPLNRSLGVLGGGQLARMLLMSAARHGLETSVFCQDGFEPAAQVCAQRTLAKFSDQEALVSFFSSADAVTFESEFLDVSALKSAWEKSHRKPLVFPSFDLMSTLQDRRTQKAWLNQFRIPTADWMPIESLEDFARATQSFQDGFVLKTVRGGYDGFGTRVIHSQRFNDQEHLEFIKKQVCIAEEKIPFKRELAVIAVCNGKKVRFFPWVESIQTSHQCDRVWGPIQVKSKLNIEKKIAKALIKSQYIGCLGIEFFEARGKILVNELAPRVHNSGHYSLDACQLSQFDLHWMAGLGLPLPQPQLLSKKFVMMNLSGASHDPWVLPEKVEGRLHWYGKKQNRPLRKMGHLNYMGSNLKILMNLANRDKKRMSR